MAAHRYAEVGAGSVTLTVTDDDGGRASAQVEVVQPPANQAPQAENASVTAVNGAAVEINLEATDPDNGPQPLAFSIVSPPSHGRVVLLPPATLMAPAEPEAVYFPDVGYAGPDSFSFTASDGKASSNAATVALTVTAPNSPPDCSAVNATPSLLWPPNHELVEVTLTGASDPDGDVVDPAVPPSRRMSPSMASVMATRPRTRSELQRRMQCSCERNAAAQATDVSIASASPSKTPTGHLAPARCALVSPRAGAAQGRARSSRPW